jgi:hypothetical protein
MRGSGLNELDVDGTDELPGGKVQNPIARTVVAVPDEHATKGFWGELIHVAVL